MERDVKVKGQFIVVDKDDLACLYVDAYDEAITESMKMG